MQKLITIVTVILKKTKILRYTKPFFFLCFCSVLLCLLFTFFCLNSGKNKMWKKASEKLFKLIQPYYRREKRHFISLLIVFLCGFSTCTDSKLIITISSLLIFLFFNQFYVKKIDLLCN